MHGNEGHSPFSGGRGAETGVDERVKSKVGAIADGGGGAVSVEGRAALTTCSTPLLTAAEIVVASCPTASGTPEVMAEEEYVVPPDGGGVGGIDVT